MSSDTFVPCELSQMSSVAIGDRNQLPSLSGVYVVVDAEIVVYVGLSINLRKRWLGHHRLRQILAKFPAASLHFYHVPRQHLADEERRLILLLNPTLNGQSIEPSITITSREKADRLDRWIAEAKLSVYMNNGYGSLLAAIRREPKSSGLTATNKQ